MFRPLLMAASSSANATFRVSRRKFSGESKSSPAWWEPIVQLAIAGTIVVSAIASVQQSVSATITAANAEKAVAELKTAQEKALATEKETMAKILAAEKEVLKTQADSVKTQVWLATVGPYAAAGVVGIYAVTKGK